METEVYMKHFHDMVVMGLLQKQYNPKEWFATYYQLMLKEKNRDEQNKLKDFLEFVRAELYNINHTDSAFIELPIPNQANIDKWLEPLITDVQLKFLALRKKPNLFHRFFTAIKSYRIKVVKNG